MVRPGTCSDSDTHEFARGAASFRIVRSKFAARQASNLHDQCGERKREEAHETLDDFTILVTALLEGLGERNVDHRLLEYLFVPQCAVGRANPDAEAELVGP